MRNIALKLMYNGTAYHGWQVQKTVSSVCETMEKGLSKVCGGNVKLVGCGRTDAGVHAERYIANFHTDSRIPVERLPFAINTHTPEDIVVREALEVAEDFNAILSCQKKEYTYRIYNSRIKNPFYVNRAYFYPKHLDEEVMDRAARAFEGTHDFKAVRSVGTETKTTVRTVHYCRCLLYTSLSRWRRQSACSSPERCALRATPPVPSASAAAHFISTAMRCAPSMT